MKVAVVFPNVDTSFHFIQMLCGIGYVLDDAIQTKEHCCIAIRIDTASKHIIGYIAGESSAQYALKFYRNTTLLVDKILDLSHLHDDDTNIYFQCGSVQNARDFQRFVQICGFRGRDTAFHSDRCTIIAIYNGGTSKLYNVLIPGLGDEVDISYIFGENQMSNSVCVKVNSAELSEALQKTAFKMGFRWKSGNTDISHATRPYIVFDKNMAMTTYSGPPNHCTIVSTYQWEDMIAALQKLLETQIKIGQYTVVFNDDNIQVGCQTIPHELMKTIYKRAFPIELDRV